MGKSWLCWTAQAGSGVAHAGVSKVSQELGQTRREDNEYNCAQRKRVRNLDIETYLKEWQEQH